VAWACVREAGQTQSRVGRELSPGFQAATDLAQAEQAEYGGPGVHCATCTLDFEQKVEALM
jgi:hypothetical protein